MFLINSEVSLATKSNQGANTHKIRDLSVYADGFSIGFFNVPTDIPILDEDDNTMINVAAGIRNNGLGANPLEYPFYKIQEFDFTYQEERQIPFDIEFEYRDDVKFTILEGFESTHEFNADFDNDPETKITKSNDARSGSFSGKFSINEDNPRVEVGTDFIYSADALENSPVYLELDYKNEIPFQVGVLGYNQMQGIRDYKILLIESEDWNKIYIELTNEIIGSNNQEFQIIFRSIPDPDTFGSVWLDNIKLVHF